MSKRQSAKYKLDRRMGENIWGRPNSPVNKRSYGPGQHGQNAELALIRPPRPGEHAVRALMQEGRNGEHNDHGEQQAYAQQGQSGGQAHGEGAAPLPACQT